jgi:hypothetical protein
MDSREFCERMIAEWEAKSREASEKADLAAFEFPNAKSKTTKRC